MLLRRKPARFGDGRKTPADECRRDQVRVDDYDAIVLPGGQINPDLLRINGNALKFIHAFYDQNKVVAAVCRAPWLLIQTGIVRGRRATSYKSIKTDMINAGAKWENSEVVTDQGIVISRQPSDLEAFSKKIMEEVIEGNHERRAAYSETRCGEREPSRAVGRVSAAAVPPTAEQAKAGIWASPDSLVITEMTPAGRQ